MANTPEQLLSVLEDTAMKLSKAQINLKKCPKQRLTKGYIETRIKDIEEYWSTYKNTHIELVKCVPKPQRLDIPYFTNEDYFVHEDLYVCLLADLNDLLSTYIKSSPVSMQANYNSDSGLSREVHVKLPRIQLPTFSGIYDEWPAYQDLFTSLVHDNQTLTKVQKLHYLKSSLTGEALSLLKHVQVTEVNYEESFRMLKARFGNKPIIVNSILKRLFTQRKISVQTASNIKSILDTTTECLNALKNLELTTSSWDPLIIFLVVQKLDPETHREWEEVAYKDNAEELPDWDALKMFLQAKFRTLELVTPPTREKSKGKEYAVHMSTSSTTTPSKQRSCAMCNEDHTLCHCEGFIKLSPTERCEYIKQHNLCYNCLAPGHSAYRCRLKMSCRKCHKRHHTLTHQSTPMTSSNQPGNKKEQDKDIETQQASAKTNVSLSSHVTATSSTAILATALVPVREHESGQVTVLRALIDHGSQATFMSERAAQMLRLKRTPVNGTITGVGSTTTNVKHSAEIQLLSRHDASFNFTVKAYIISTRLTAKLPSQTISTNTWPHLQGLSLADPSFNKSGRVDLLLGVDVCAQIIKGEVIKGPPGTPCAQNTSLGWILFGNVETKLPGDDIIVMHLDLDLNNMLKRMWEQDPYDKPEPTPEERKCEEFYETTTMRNKDGRYIVRLPKKTNMLLSTQGDTRTIALKRLYQLEQRFKNNPKLKSDYATVMKDYELNYMEEVPKQEIANPSVYLPHHAVVKEEKETTKLRTVFNASQKGSNNVSLNDELMVGPQIQDDMRSLIMRWRMKKVCFVADIQKMYLQVIVNEEDRDLQRILWRYDEQEPVKDYRLTRVTFGTASAPYLAVRTLHQVAIDEGQNYPEAAKIISRDYFMDDMMSGKDNVTDAIKVAKEIDVILQKGGFKLKKWCSNNADFLKAFEESERSSHVNLDITLDGITRALGLYWNMGKDQFQYSLNLPAKSRTLTKRTILADLQRLFDPLGWLAPSVLPAKLLIQKLWLQGVTWDEEIDEDIATEWNSLRESFHLHLPEIEIDRWLHTSESNMNNITIHGFCDASNRAYAAVAYLRVRTDSGEVKTSILAAKTKLAPTKPQSLPRLELSGAVLLAGLLKQIKEAMNIPSSQIYAWTDSTIVLSWLFGDPTRWNTYVRNRVVAILDNIGNHNWYHVKSPENPADAGSRGQSLLDLKDDELWWTGPKWLKEGEIQYSRPKAMVTDLERKEILQVNLKLKNENSITSRFENCDTLQELLRVIVYCKRFLKGRIIENKDLPVNTEELDDAMKTCLRMTQKDSFEEEIEHLKTKRPIKRHSKLNNLKPYLDDDGILRVGGRLRHSDLNEDGKHPIILDRDNNLTALLVADAHLKTLHGGVQLTLCFLRTRFWILKVKTLVKSKIRKCLICAKLNATARSQQMGDLPRARVTPAKPFLNTGIDFAGPYQVLMSKGRGARTNKAYIAIFVCMSTKAIHLELVGDLTSDAFIGAFRRFVARRGRCAHIWSDQGRNFVGANKLLAGDWAEAKLQFEGPVAEKLALDGTKWHFIPAYSPHMGGLWEAGVKSMKHHLKRILTKHVTYEEMITLLCQVEACLNSRPLGIIDDTSTDNVQPLTPGHFLIGETPITVPTPNLQNIPVSHLSRWHHQQRLMTEFWHRWQQEYLSRMQQRSKWHNKVKEFEIGHIVLIKADNLPPAKWMMGRIVDKHPGKDAKGVRQGDPLSPKLFSAILESVFRDLEWENIGISIDGKKLNHLRFADDLVLITDNATTLQHMLQQLSEASRKVGLTMNLSKTKLMTNREEKVVTLDDASMEYVRTYTYLGQLIAFRNQTKNEIDRRVANAWNRYWSLKEVLKSKHFPMIAKKKVFDSCVLPCLTYGCQTWALNQKHLLALRTCQRGMERSMLGVRKMDRIRSEDIRSITKVEDIIKKVRQLKWRWTGHMTRDSKTKWTKIITEWQPRDGKRKRGRQVKRRMDDIKKVAENTWPRKARDREVWKQLEEAYVSQDTLITKPKLMC
ncbi:uncharacterized protein LOC111349816 [Spodoptera litura]|uniref:Uncharacterized protein LOC111349816 n=1 Tax=Spodoptera litura TaxID=69820 RepID=A0A9J7DQZ8_SPOLT|nr:uncharacterized protein LOC111349816 [Spodoptera litura]